MVGATFLVILLAAALPGGQHVPLSGPGAGSTFLAGQVIEVRWSAIPAAAREAELLLSVDGGHTYPLRLTEELTARSGSFLWRVPSLFSDQASLALRVGLDGREILITTGATFRLRPDPTPGKAALRWKSGEIWLDSDGESEEMQGVSHLPPDGFCAEPERLTAVPRDATPAFPARLAAAGSSRRFSTAPRSDLREPAETSRPASVSRTPLTIPQRI